MKNFCWFILTGIFLSCSGVSQKKTEPSGPELSAEANSPVLPSLSPSELGYYKNKVDHFVESTFSRRPFNGSLLVAKNGEIIYEKYSGFRNPRVKTDSITPSTSFHLASVSKTFTAMAILKLWEEGKLNIEDSVSKYLVGFPLQGVTVKTLLNHRSGIPNYVHYMERLGWDRKRTVTNKEVLDFIIARHNEIDIGTPDRGFSYSNTNYALLALIIERVSGLSYAQYLKLTFFDPLGMKDSYVFNSNDSARSLPSFFSSGRPYPFDYLDMVYGDKNVYSTVRDMLKWDLGLQNGHLFKDETLAKAYAGYSFEKPGIHNYGLGWRMFLLKSGKKFIYHNGWWHGNRTVFYRLLDDKVTIIALSNNDFSRVYSAKKLADIFGNYFQNGKDLKDAEANEPNSTVRSVRKSANMEKDHSLSSTK